MELGDFIGVMVGSTKGVSYCIWTHGISCQFHLPQV